MCRISDWGGGPASDPKFHTCHHPLLRRRVHVGTALTSVSPEMHLSPNVGSDRSWVWNVAADFAEGSDHTNETLAIRFGNSESEFKQEQRVRLGRVLQAPLCIARN